MFLALYFGTYLRCIQIRCAIDEWATGIFEGINFEEKTYKPHYKRYLEDIQDFETMSSEDHIMQDICMKLAEYGRYASSSCSATWSLS